MPSALKSSPWDFMSSKYWWTVDPRQSLPPKDSLGVEHQEGAHQTNYDQYSRLRWSCIDTYGQGSAPNLRAPSRQRACGTASHHRHVDNVQHIAGMTMNPLPEYSSLDTTSDDLMV